MLAPIIITAVIAFLIVICIIYFKEIKDFILSKFSKKKSKDKKESKPKEEKKTKAPEFTVEDFKPIAKSEEDNVRDASLESLFTGDDDYFNDLTSEFPDEIFEEVGNDSNSNKSDFDFNDDFMDFSRYLKNDKKKDNRTISEKIKDLPPDIKALLIDNLLKRKDD